jgi:hypothetical protein
VNARLINCPTLISDELTAGAEATAVPLPDGTIGGLADFGQRTEAGRLSENRDKRTVDSIYRRCHAENVRINTPPRRKILGIF